MSTVFPIYINCRFLVQQSSGMHRFARELLTAWDTLRKEMETTIPVMAFVPGKCLDIPKWKTIPIHMTNGWGGHLWEQSILPAKAWNGLLISLLSTGPIIHSNQIVTLHDASAYDCPQFYSLRFRIAHRVLTDIVGRRADRLFTVSSFSAKRLSINLGVDQQKFTIIPNGCDHILRPESNLSILERHNLNPRQYFLCIGNDTPNKNLISAIKAHSQLNMPNIELVHAGASIDRVFKRSVEIPSNMFKRLGPVSDGELRALYENALAFLFPSRYEGFGIPPLEAMALRCPVISSKNGAMTEILGDAAIFVDPEDSTFFAETMRRIAEDAALRDSLIEKGLLRAAQFTWRASAQRFDAELNAVIAQEGIR